MSAIIATRPENNSLMKVFNSPLIPHREQNGKIMTIDTPEKIVSNYHKHILGIKADNTYKLIESLEKYEFTESVYPFGEFLHYTDKRNTTNEDALRAYLTENGLNDIVIENTKPGIEDVFMYLMKQKETADA